MNHILDRGLALYWGTSEWSAIQINEAYHIARHEHLVPPLMEQPQYNMLHRDRVEREYLPLYRDIGLGTTTWSPLASGLLTGKYNDGIPKGSRLGDERFRWLKDIVIDEGIEDNLRRVRALRDVAAELDCTMAQLAIAWCASNEHVSTVITGASRVEQVQENMKAVEFLDALTPEVLASIESILGNAPASEPDERDG